MSPTDQRQLARYCVDWTARQIHDPVWRLRYLRSMAPRVLPSNRWKPRILAGVLTLCTLGLVAAPLSLRRFASAHAAVPAASALPAPPIQRVELPATPSADVWQVEKTAGFDTYSNGLRIENQYAVSHRPRAYIAFSPDYPDRTTGEKRTQPAGIVYHTTESLQAPFESSQNNRLKRVGESLIDYVRRRRCYNFLIDRFGRVFRIVDESDAADHAGHSVWADDRYFYVNLNDSFVGVSFEAQTGAGVTQTSVGAAQLRAAAMLTEMLRSRYKIPGGNCVTHAQVSVNPSNMQVGYHVDWASSFPFEALGLPDNYATPSPAIALFGFACDASFQQRAGVHLAAGALCANRALIQRAAAANLSLTAYRKMLNQRYWKIVSAQSTTL